MILVGFAIGTILWTCSIVLNLVYVGLLYQSVKDYQSRLLFRFAVSLLAINILAWFFVCLYVNRSGVLS